MSDKIKNIIVSVLFCLFIFGISIICIVKPADEISSSERRPLKQFPEISVSRILSGGFMKEFESYTQDQFPVRDYFRTIKALWHNNIYSHKDNNGIYSYNGHFAEIDYPYSEKSLDYAARKLDEVYTQYFKDKDINVFLSVIPDKNYFMAEDAGVLHIDYEKLVSELTGKLGYMQYIDIFDKLSLEDYYKTDSHWRQENIIDVADKLATEMGTSIPSDYFVKDAHVEFKGVYYGQSALMPPSEDLKYLTNDTIDGFLVFDGENKRKIPVYNFDKAKENDPYEMFLDGPLTFVTIENPAYEGEKELIIFRDSFTSSIAPLLAQGYSKITLVDIRYTSSKTLSKFIDFKDQDVLFLYSTGIINNSNTLK